MRRPWPLLGHSARGGGGLKTLAADCSEEFIFAYFPLQKAVI